MIVPDYPEPPSRLRPPKSRSVQLRKVDVTRVLRAAKAAGVIVSSFEVSSDGTIKVLTVVGCPAPTDEFGRWEDKL